MKIEGLDAIKVLNSRSEETIAVYIKTPKGKVSAASPSGKSRGKYEINQFSSKGINFSISFLNLIGKRLAENQIVLEKFEDLEKVENLIKEYDKSENFEFLGGNALFALEAALLRAMALEKSMELWKFLNPKANSLPRSLGNAIGGGMHIKKELKSDIQEFLLCPETKHLYDSHFLSLQAYKELKKKLLECDKNWNGELTDEKAMATSLPTEYTLTLIRDVSKIIEKKYKFRMQYGMDMAASTFFDAKTQEYVYKNLPKRLDSKKQLQYVSSLIKQHNLFYVEDPFQEDDFESFSNLLKKNPKCLIVGDDLTATNLERLKKAVKMKSINAIIIKPNQNGSLLRTKEVVDFAKKSKIVPIISHRSGETSDYTIADLAVAWKIPFIKTGILGRERLAKIDRLIRIEREMGA